MRMVTVVQMEQPDSHHMPSQLNRPVSACPPLNGVIPHPLPSPSPLDYERRFPTWIPQAQPAWSPPPHFTSPLPSSTCLALH